ncbi:MAG: lytic transglycosylase domain-containing protein [Anaerolineales bacterium]
MINADLQQNYSDTASKRGGYFPGILIPPFAVILMGVLLAFFSWGIIGNHDVMASSNLSENNDKANSYAQGNNASNNTFISSGPSNNKGMGLSTSFTPEVLYWKDRIFAWSSEYDLDPNLIATVMQIESCGDLNATSYAAAMGLFQVMPFHFQDSEDPYDIETNAYRGLNYLKRAMEASNGDVSLAMAGYNGGISVINKPSSTWADETQRYVYWGSGIYQEAVQGNGGNQRLAEWLSNGGASLCKQAATSIGLNY